MLLRPDLVARLAVGRPACAVPCGVGGSQSVMPGLGVWLRAPCLACEGGLCCCGWPRVANAMRQTPAGLSSELPECTSFPPMHSVKGFTYCYRVAHCLELY